MSGDNSICIDNSDIYLFISALLECKQLGIRSNGKAVAELVQTMMDFFFRGKSFHGKVYTKKSRNKVVTAQKGREKSNILDEIENFCDERADEAPILVSCEGKLLSELSGALAEPYLVVTSNDLNCCSFAKGLGNILLQDKCNIFMETSDLSKSGKGRLKLFLEEVSGLFDNRLRVILFGSPCLEEMSEKRFDKSVLEQVRTPLNQTPSNKRKKSSEHSDSCSERNETIWPKEVLQAEIDRTKESLSKSVKENLELNKRVKVSEEQNVSLLEKYQEMEEDKNYRLNMLQKENSCLLEKLKVMEIELNQEKENSSKKPNVITVTRETQTKLVLLTDKNLQTAMIDSVTSNSVKSVDSKECQTKKVDVSITPLTHLVNKIDADVLVDSSTTKVYKHIRNFVCSSKSVKLDDGKFCWQGEIVKGKHIIEHSNLLNFEGEGATVLEAKENAFKTFLALLREEAEK